MDREINKRDQFGHSPLIQLQHVQTNVSGFGMAEMPWVVGIVGHHGDM